MSKFLRRRGRLGPKQKEDDIFAEYPANNLHIGSFPWIKLVTVFLSHIQLEYTRASYVGE